MGFFGSGDKISTTDQRDERQAGSDQAIVQRDASQAGGTANTSASQGSNSVGAAGRYNQASGVGSAVINAEAGSIQGGVKGDVISNNVDQALLAQFGQTLADVVTATGNNAEQGQNTLKDLVDAQNAQASGLVTTLADKLAARANATETGGASDQNKIILWIVLGLLGVVALIFWRR